MCLRHSGLFNLLWSDLKLSLSLPLSLLYTHAPLVAKVSISGIEEDPISDTIEGFVKPANEADATLVLTNSAFFVIPKAVLLPPGYNPVFHAACLGLETPPHKPEMRGDDSVFKLLRPQDKLRLEHISANAAGGIPPGITLLKPFAADSAKEARFDAYQLLIHRRIPRKLAIIFVLKPYQ